jgi:tripartite-type tricarboxylate transporter receptor subunit TctC
MNKSITNNGVNMHRNRRRLVIALAATALMPKFTIAQTPGRYPLKAIQIVVPFPPGGYADVLSRVLAAELAPRYGHAITVDNRPGAGGNIGAELVARAAPDGYTLLMGSIASNAVNTHLYKKLTFDPQSSFTPVAFIADAETVLVVHPSVPAQNVAELIRLAKLKPELLSYASAGNGSTGHLAGELFKYQTGVSLLHVPYKGNAPALNDLVAGQVSMSFATLQTALPFIQAGRLKALGVLGAKRSLALAQVPTLIESGVKGLEVRNWIGLFAPAGTADPIVQQLHRDVEGVLRKPETQERLSKLALTHIDMTSREFAAFVTSESQRWGAVIKSVGITSE